MSIGTCRRVVPTAQYLAAESTSRAASPLIVTKVGGSLLRHEEDLWRAASAIAQRRRDGDSLMVVVSAFKGVTDLLEQAALYALDPNHKATRPREILARLRRRHEDIARHVGGAGLVAEVQPTLVGVERQVLAVRESGLLGEKTYARLLCAGERLSAPILAAAIRESGALARAIDAETLGLRARGHWRNGVCDIAASRSGLMRNKPRLNDEILVLTGFYGINAEGEVVLFGRGGTDDTACAVAAGLDAARLEFWKDVPGCMSADPREVREARVVNEISFDEIATLGAYGARIIHHGSLTPLKNRSTDVVVRALDSSSRRALRGVGTRLIEKRRPRSAELVALAAQRGCSHFRVHCPSEEKELAGAILGSIDENRIEIKEWSMAPGSIQFTACASKSEDLLRGLRPVLNGHPVEHRSAPSRVGMVGESIGRDPEIFSRALRYLESREIRAEIEPCSTGDAGLSCVVHQDDLKRALTGLHEHFFMPPMAAAA